MSARRFAPLALPTALLVIGALLMLAGEQMAGGDQFRSAGQVQTLGELTLLLGGGLFFMKAGQILIDAVRRKRGEDRAGSALDD